MEPLSRTHFSAHTDNSSNLTAPCASPAAIPLYYLPLLPSSPFPISPPDTLHADSAERKPSRQETNRQFSEAFQRLTKQARLELAHLTDASKASIAMLDSLIAKLQVALRGKEV